MLLDQGAEAHRAIASPVSDRSARRPTRRKPSAELVLAWQTALLSTHQPTRQAGTS
ncbi:hypothetical protein [Saccharothrix sp. ST-888]|uniref:hypothetical protein n=1 Tax=Saccharothrix sp. ST-888 TaxID=1427391 RepID=UPI000A98528D|nr:hypothetical protein [Saccharothrix sp. ST-888]